MALVISAILLFTWLVLVAFQVTTSVALHLILALALLSFVLHLVRGHQKTA